MEFLKSEINEKNFLIRSLITKHPNDVIDCATHIDDSNIATNKKRTRNSEEKYDSDHETCCLYVNSDSKTSEENNVHIGVEESDEVDNSKNIDFQLQYTREELHAKYLESIRNIDGISPLRQYSNISSTNSSDFTDNESKDGLTFEKKMQFMAGYSMSELDKSLEYNPVPNVIKPWPTGTICILGDSMLCNLEEARMGNNVKVRFHRGGIVEDMFDHVNAILKRKPTYIILHVGSNNTMTQNPKTIVDNIIKLKDYIESRLKTCTVIISSLIMRNDNKKANNTTMRVNVMLYKLNLQMVNNDNISDIHLGKKGLHLNKRGVGRFALNLISHIRCL